MPQTQITTFCDNEIDSIYQIECAANPFPWTLKTLQSCIGGRYVTKQLLVDGKAVGFYVGDLVIDELTLMEICVHPDHQGKGYGQLLVDDFLKFAKNNDVVKCHLEVRAKNISAQMLYIKNGFMQIHRRTGYYPAKFGYEDALVMSLSL
ncbi:ribosomal protein S18-alanine N-acetyltransferase [Thalassomonas sp. M1454]|uniref:ribosomal protein S18-alanine N-acetyltransferase n=1 Tax=Thalassomonas sp. M1454 TaxID=2594477 RepID=UPI00117D15A3|nr:ribosomal protein S18-alanine N-acetyltransferase [Thalassomonas sp. M1454]TRX55762.1 ribosomal-protein-alanine N-acetyltransferase [Thalassomonas sp. M1454]